MSDKKIDILDSVWFGNLTEGTTIGIVKINTGYGVKWYIGLAEGDDKSYDEQFIAKWGTPIFPDQLKEFFDIDIKE